MSGAGAEVGHFQAPKRSLSDIDADIAGKLIAAAADVALIVEDGVIQDIASHAEEISAIGLERWLGRSWIDTVTVESRPKIEALLSGVAAPLPRSRQVNHPVPDREDIPILYTAVAVGNAGRVVAVGRDLRVIAAMQQRLVDAQQSMERDYSRLRHAETRYRLLFHLASEAVIVVDAATMKVTEANPATTELLAIPAQRIAGRAFPSMFEEDSAEAVRELLTRVKTVGRGNDISVRLDESDREFRLTASLFRQDRASHFLIRLAPLQPGSSSIIVPATKSRLLTIVESLPDGFAVVGMDRRIVTVNQAFLDLAQLATEDLVRGEPLDRWLGRSGVDVNVLVASLREHGSIRRFATVMRGEYGTVEEVEVSAVSVTTEDQPCIGLTIRIAGRRPATGSARPENPASSVARLTELVGRVSLKELVRETTDTVEKLCIEAALELTDDNRASAAEMLGLSRQSLYAKLRRYGLGDLDGDDEA